MRGWMVVMLVSVAAVACGDDPQTNNSTPGSDAGMNGSGGDGGSSSADMGTSGGGDGGGMTGGDDMGMTGGGDGGTTGGTDGTLPEIPETHGVIYVGHLESTNIRMYRTDGTALEAAGSFDTGGPILDMALDRRGDVLYASHPADDEVSVWELDTPADANTDVADPTELARISFERIVLTISLDELHDRLYVAEALPSPGNGQPQPNMTLHIIDVSDPASPTKLATSVVPSTASWDVDPVRRVGFFHKESTDELFGYDLRTDEAISLGDPIAMTDAAWYPEDNQFAFQARNLTVDPYTNRLFAGRPMGTLSELIAIEYPAAIPTGNATYADAASMDDLVKLNDAFDVSVDATERQNLLDAYQPVVDPVSDIVLMSAGGWNGTMSTAMMINYAAGDIGTLEGGCNEHSEGFGCFLRYYSSGTPSSYGTTDGAACADYTHKVVIGTTYDPNEPTNPGYLHAFTYDEDGTMAPFNSEAGDTFTTDGYPVAVECH